MRTILILVITGMSLCDNLAMENNTIQRDWWLDIKKQYKLMSRYFLDRDFTALASLFAKDCILIPPDIEQLTGTGAVHVGALLIGVEGAHSVTYIPEKIIAENTRMAVERGSFVLKRVDNTTLDVDE